MNTRIVWLVSALAAFGPATLAEAPAAPAAAAPAAQTYTLRYKFKTGDVGYYKMTMDSNGTIGGGPGGQSLPLKQHMVFIYHQAVTSVNAADGAATLTTKFDSATLSITMNGQTMPGSDAMTDQLKGRTLTTTVSPTGKTTSVKADDLGGSSGVDFSSMANFQGAALLPDGPVKAGDTWKSTVDLNVMPGAQMTGVQAAAVSTFTGVSAAGGNSVATISQTTAGQIDAATSPAGAAMTMAGKVNGTGTLKFDLDAGTLLSQTATTTLNMTLTPKGAGAGPIPAQFQITTSLEKVDAPGVPKAAPGPAATAAPAAAPAAFIRVFTPPAPLIRTETSVPTRSGSPVGQSF